MTASTIYFGVFVVMFELNEFKMELLIVLKCSVKLSFSLIAHPTNYLLLHYFRIRSFIHHRAFKWTTMNKINDWIGSMKFDEDL